MIKQCVLIMFFSWQRKYGTSSVENLSKTRQSEFIENKIRWHHFKGHHHSRIIFIDIALRNEVQVLISKGFFKLADSISQSIAKSTYLSRHALKTASTNSSNSSVSVSEVVGSNADS